MPPRTPSHTSRLSLSYRAVCEARAALEEAYARVTGTAPEARQDFALTVSAARARYTEASRQYNETLLRCPE